MPRIGRLVTPGQRLKIKAREWNMVREIHPPLRVGTNQQSRGRQTGIISIRNDTAQIVPRFGILGITGVVNEPTGDNAEFYARAVFTGDTPDIAEHVGNFVICLDAILAGEIGPALISGIGNTTIDMTDEDHTHADVLDASVVKLESAPSGSAQILWVESGTGDKLAIIRLGNSSPGAMVPVTVTKTSGNPGDDDDPCTYVYTATLLSGVEIGTNMSPAKPRPAIGAQVFQTGSAGFGLAFYHPTDGWTLWDAGEVFDLEVCDES